MSTIKLDLTLDEAQTILNALAARPYSEVANIIPKIMVQARDQQQAKAAAATPAEEAESQAIAAE